MRGFLRARTAKLPSVSGRFLLLKSSSVKCPGIVRLLGLFTVFLHAKTLQDPLNCVLFRAGLSLAAIKGLAGLGSLGRHGLALLFWLRIFRAVDTYLIARAGEWIRLLGLLLTEVW